MNSEMGMSPHRFQVQEPCTLLSSGRRPSLRRLVISLAVLIYITELIAMIVLYRLQIRGYVVTSLLDGMIMVTLILPGLYYLQLKPLMKQMENYIQAEMKARWMTETMGSVALALSRTLDLEQVMQTLLDHLQIVVVDGAAGVSILDEEKCLEARVLRGYGSWANQVPIPALPLEGDITDGVIQRLVEDQTDQWLVVPISANEKIIGLVELSKTESGGFTPEEIRWVEALVGQAVVAIQNARLYQQVHTSRERLQSLNRKMVKIQENERRHVARELHDEAGQALSSLKLNLGCLEQDPECPAHIRRQLQNLKGVSDGVLENLHRLAMDLRPVALDHLGLVAALEQYARQLKSEQRTIHFKAVGFEGDRLPPDVEVSIYRIVQEALTNVVRYSMASKVGILMERGQGKVKVFVEDNGVGFDLNRVTGERLGLVGMRERVEMLGGSLTIESSPGKGTSVIVEAPDDNSNLDRR